jgi:hypothetical protein
VERRVEAGDRGGVGQDGRHRRECRQRLRLVERGEVRQGRQLRLDSRIDSNGTRECGSAVDDPVADRVDRAEARDRLRDPRRVGIAARRRKIHRCLDDKGSYGPLREGELEHARQWGAELAESLGSTGHQA